MAKPSPLSPGVYLVATPTGHLEVEDIAERALRILRGRGLIARQDTLTHVA